MDSIIIFSNWKQLTSSKWKAAIPVWSGSEFLKDAETKRNWKKPTITILTLTHSEKVILEANA